MEGLSKSGIVVEDKPQTKIIQKDPDDDKFILSAIIGKADYVISGDPHLLGLKKYQGIEVITPAEFVRLLQKE